MRRSGFVSVDVADLAATAVEFYAPAAELKNIALTFHSDGPLPISGDPSRPAVPAAAAISSR